MRVIPNKRTLKKVALRGETKVTPEEFDELCLLALIALQCIAEANTTLQAESIINMS